MPDPRVVANARELLEYLHGLTPVELEMGIYIGGFESCDVEIGITPHGWVELNAVGGEDDDEGDHGTLIVELPGAYEAEAPGTYGGGCDRNWRCQLEPGHPGLCHEEG